MRIGEALAHARKHDSNPCALYAAWHDGILLVSENLAGIKDEVKAWVKS